MMSLIILTNDIILAFDFYLSLHCALQPLAVPCGLSPSCTLTPLPFQQYTAAPLSVFCCAQSGASSSSQC